MRSPLRPFRMRLVDPAARTAVVMPICNEDVPRVFAGLRATYESLARTDLAMQFDMFVLSDTNDADSRVAEVEAWFETCRALDAFGRIFYRWRQHRIKRKSGNIADFCRRWGRNYRYLVILDADSVMSGDCLTTLVRIDGSQSRRGHHPDCAECHGRDTLHARVQQFASRVYGPLVHGGLHFWQLGESHYWGTTRSSASSRSCGTARLRRLTGRGLLVRGDSVARFCRGGADAARRLVSVDRLRRPGSYEETPPNLIDELKRDRRWCQGNLMNFRLSVMNGLHAAHRAVFVSGVMAYAAGLLWLAFLVLSTILLAVHTLRDPRYFVAAYQMFPLWPEWHPEWALTLVGVTVGLLFLPKFLAGDRRHGARRETVRRRCPAVRQPAGRIGRLHAARADPDALSRALRRHHALRMGRVVAVAAAQRCRNHLVGGVAAAWHADADRPGLGGGRVFAEPGVPVVAAAGAGCADRGDSPVGPQQSRVTRTEAAHAGLFVIPEESHPPCEIQTTMEEARRADGALPGFVEGVVDPGDHGAAVRDGPRPVATQTCAARPTRHTRARGAATGAG